MGPAGICGYCGEKDNPCVVSLKDGQSSKIRDARTFAKSVTDGTIVDLDTGAKHISTCPCYYNFNLKSAKKADASKNCSNVPMTCAQCYINDNKTTVIWKYAMHQHYLKHHPGKELPDEYTVGEGEARRLWLATLHPGDVAPQRPYQQPPKPPLPWIFNLKNPSPSSSNADNSVAVAACSNSISSYSCSSHGTAAAAAAAALCRSAMKV